MNPSHFFEMPWDDWFALVWLLTFWIGYAYLTDMRTRVAPNLITAMDGYRQMWMRQVARRETKSVDVALIAYLSQGPAFMASTTMFILGGLVAALSGGDTAVHMITEFTGAPGPSHHVWQIRIATLIATFTYAFFKFSWGMRQYNYCAILIAAMPDDIRECEERGIDLPRRAAKLASYASASINSGFRACYFGTAALAWLVHPMLSVATTLVVVCVLYMREFFSPTLRAVLFD